MGLQWSPYLAIGVSVIDNQRQELFSRFNNLLNAIERGEGPQELRNMTAFLEDYTISHFGAEEALMSRYAYVASEAHNSQHASFKRDLESFKARLEDPKTTFSVASEMLRQLGDWLVNHVGRSDKQMGMALKAAMMLPKAA